MNKNLILCDVFTVNRSIWCPFTAGASRMSAHFGLKQKTQGKKFISILKKIALSGRQKVGQSMSPKFADVSVFIFWMKQWPVQYSSLCNNILFVRIIPSFVKNCHCSRLIPEENSDFWIYVQKEWICFTCERFFCLFLAKHRLTNKVDKTDGKLYFMDGEGRNRLRCNREHLCWLKSFWLPAFVHE